MDADTPVCYANCGSARGHPYPHRPPRSTRTRAQLYKIDTIRNLLYIKGHVPGPKGCYVRVTDAIKGAHFPAPPPVPTFAPEVRWFDWIGGGGLEMTGKREN